MQKIKLLNFVLLIAALFSVFAMSLTARAQDFTQGYSTDDTLLRGSIVAIDDTNTNKVFAAALDDADRVIGVVVRNTDSAVTLADDRTGVFVASNGRFEVLVSSLNGSINAGDTIAASSIHGVGVAADETHSHIVGVAVESIDFSDNSSILSQTTITDISGEPLTVGIARIMVDLNVGVNPDAKDSLSVPGFLAELGESFAGQPVSALRIYAALGVMLVSILVAGSLIYSAVRSSIISIGRNPLSKKSVLAGLAQVVLVSLVIFISGLVAVYLILKI